MRLYLNYCVLFCIFVAASCLKNLSPSTFKQSRLVVSTKNSAFYTSHGLSLTFPAQQSKSKSVQALKKFERVAGLQLATSTSSQTEKKSSLWILYLKTMDTLTTLFPLWTLLFAGLAIHRPESFAWFTTRYFTASLGALMLSMGITLTPDDFVRVGKQPGAVIVGFLLCYGLCPLLGIGLGKVFKLPVELIAGIVLVGSINGGQASNLCTYIAKGDVALSVLMTTVTTIAGIFMTPLLCKVILGAVVPVDAVGIAASCLQVVLAPIILGMGLNKYFPKKVEKVLPITPVIGVVSTCLLVASAVAQCAPAIKSAGLQLQIPIMLLHLVSGLVGYFIPARLGFTETQCRTMAIETAMKSSAFGFLLAKLHFSQYLARVPSAVSVVWMALVGASLAVVWRFIPVSGSDSSENSRPSEPAQKFLEADPYYDMSNIPMQLFKAKEPHQGKIISVKRIVGAQATGETCDVVIDHFGKMPYWEGQSYGVIPPGTNPKNGKPYTNRLYSIASTRYGDDMKGTTTTLCVRRATYWDPELGREDPAKKGVCSNFLCDAKPGDEVMLTGPAGKVMLMPEKDPNADIIMVATGTGIAPYRSFLRRLFVEDTPAGRAFNGLAWLFLGVANTDALLYDNDWQKLKENFPKNFRLDYALSREQTNKSGGKMYIQDKVEEYADEIFERMEKGAHIYFCGLKGMMPGILTMLEGVAQKKGIDWKDQLKEWKEAGQWHVEVY